MLSKKNFYKSKLKICLPLEKVIFIAKRFLILLVLIVFSRGPILKAQNLEWKVYNTSNSGLPGNFVYRLATDENGNIWIWAGVPDFTPGNPKLIKYNSGKWTVYDTSNSGLSGNYVSCLTADGRGNIWIGTDNGGMIKYDRTNSEGTAWTVYNTSNSGLPNNDVSCLAIDGSGNTWIGTYNGGLTKYDGINWIIYNTSNSGLPDNNVYCLAIEGSRNKWIGTGGGLVKYDDSNWTVYDTSNSGLPGNYINCLAIDRSGNVWTINRNIYGSGDLTKYDGTNWTNYNTSNSGLPDNYVYSLTLDGNGNVWIGGVGYRQKTGKGLIKYDGTNWIIYNTSNSGLPDNDVYCITLDENGNKWIGTWNGLAVFNEGGIVSSIESENNKADLPNKFILSQNYPNPFNPSTTIKYSMPKQSHVTLKVYDILGCEVATLVNEEKHAGNYEVEFNTQQSTNNKQPASGIYFYQIKAGEYISTKKMILLR